MRSVIARIHPLWAASVVLVAGCSGAAAVAPTAISPAGTARHAALERLAFSVARSGAVSPVPAELVAGARVRGALTIATKRARGRGFTYVSQYSGTPVQEYHLQNQSNGAPVCTLPGEAVNGVGVDPRGDVWVPSGTGGGQGYTQEYGRTCGDAKRKIVDPNGQPADAGFDRKGDVYILSIFGRSGAPGSVDVYNAKGALIRSLTDPTFNELIGIGTDSHDNVFVSNRESNGVATVEEFPGGKMPGTLLGNVSLGLPGAPELDKNDNLIITDWNAYTLNIYAPPYTGAPIVTAMQGLSLWCSLDRGERLLSCANLGTGAVDVYEYPGATYEYSYDNGLSPSGYATGVADRPAAPL
jgi:hypothetical protein